MTGLESFTPMDRLCFALGAMVLLPLLMLAIVLGIARAVLRRRQRQVDRPVNEIRRYENPRRR